MNKITFNEIGIPLLLIIAIVIGLVILYKRIIKLKGENMFQQIRIVGLFILLVIALIFQIYYLIKDFSE